MRDDRERLLDIQEAVERYVAKFGETPNVCLVSAGETAQIEGIEVKPVEYVRPNHFWVGRSELPAGSPLAA